MINNEEIIKPSDALTEQHFHILNERRQIRKSKKILKRLYHHWCRIIRSALKSGSILEIGGGSGNLKEFFPDSISSDIIFTPWEDVVLDALYLPFQDESLDNIILFDVLHHLIEPVHFFCEAQRTLRQKGRFSPPFFNIMQHILMIA